MSIGEDLGMPFSIVINLEDFTVINVFRFMIQNTLTVPQWSKCVNVTAAEVMVKRK